MILAIDIGGTKTLVAVFNHDKKIVEQIKFPTPKEYSEFLRSIEETKEKLTTKRFFSGAIGARFLIDRKTGILITDDVLQWTNEPIADDFEKIFNCKFSVENDSNLAGMSEANLAKNKKYKKVLYFTISTGIGTVFVVDQKIDQNVISSELGKWLFEHEGKIQIWESFASGKAISEKYGLRASELKDPESWQAITNNFAIGIINACAAYTPDLIIIGGGVGEHYSTFESYLQNSIKDMLPPKVTVPKIVGAERSEEAVIYGCLELALQKA